MRSFCTAALSPGALPAALCFVGSDASIRKLGRKVLSDDLIVRSDRTPLRDEVKRCVSSALPNCLTSIALYLFGLGFIQLGFIQFI